MSAQVHAAVLFSTHYHSLAKEFVIAHDIQFAHMACHVEEEDILFLYQLQQGISSESYAMEVALMAGIPKSVVDQARIRSEQAHQDQRSTDVRKSVQNHNWQLFTECFRTISAASATSASNDPLPLGKLADLQFRLLCSQADTSR
ncbi:MAG: hypothetical protein Q8P67_14515 [archaeon]|nr:hypothetical protein [archaeon]